MISTFGLLVSSSIIRQLSAFSVTAETVLGLTLVAVATVLAAATGPFRWKASNDDCAATSNPHAYGTYLLVSGGPFVRPARDTVLTSLPRATGGRLGNW